MKNLVKIGPISSEKLPKKIVNVKLEISPLTRRVKRRATTSTEAVAINTANTARISATILAINTIVRAISTTVVAIDTIVLARNTKVLVRETGTPHQRIIRRRPRVRRRKTDTVHQAAAAKNGAETTVRININQSGRENKFAPVLLIRTFIII